MTWLDALTGIEDLEDAEFDAGLIAEFERRGQVIETQRDAAFLHQAEDELAARDRIGVLLGLAGLVGVTVPLRTAGFASGQKGGFSL